MQTSAHSSHHRPRTKGLTVATYNVNGVNGRLPRLLEWLRETGPDLVCLQELKTDDTKVPARAIHEADYGAIWHGQRAHHGVAIFAKGETPKELRRGLPGEPSDNQSRYLEAEAKGLVISSTYLPNGNPVGSPNFEYKLLWFERFIRYAKKLYASGKPVLLAGDLNVIPTDFDIYNPTWWRFDAVMQPATRDAFRRLLAQGWMDAARQLHPAERMYTYWVNDNAFRQNKGMRLDFLLVSASLQAVVTAAGVDTEYRGREKPSDHTPTWLRCAIRPNESRLSQPFPVVLFARPAFRDNRTMNPSPGPWAFHTHLYSLPNVLLDRDGRVISCHLPGGNGALIAKAPAMADLLFDLLAGVPTEQLRVRAASIMRQIERHRVREPGEDDE